MIEKDVFPAGGEGISEGEKEANGIGTLHHFSVAFDVTHIACVAVAKGGRHARDDVGGVDQAVNRHFPEFIGKFGGTDGRASEGVTGGAAGERRNWGGARDGKGTSQPTASDMCR